MIRVLIVEDDWAAREGLRERLGDEPDFEVVAIAQNVEEALEKLTAFQPDVVILDCKLQGSFAGVQVAKEIEARRWTSRVLAYSAYGDVANVQAMLEAGALGYYVKGESTYLDMLTAIRTVHEGLPWFSTSLRTGDLNRLRGTEEEGVKKLSAREVEVLRLVEKGMSNKEIAVVLGRRLRTIKAHLEHVFTKLGVNNRMEACRVAREQGWL